MVHSIRACCVCVCFHTSSISTYISTVWRSMGSRGLRGHRVYAKTFIKDRDCGRLCENVFMYVWIGRRRGALLGWVLIPNGRVRLGVKKKVCICVVGEGRRGPWMKCVKWLL